MSICERLPAASVAQTSLAAQALAVSQGRKYACAIAGALIAASCLSSEAFAEGRKYSEWGPAVNLGCGINSATNDAGPATSKDGRSLYFQTLRSSTTQEIYVTKRPSKDDPWGAPVPLTPKIGNGVAPAFSRDGHWMFFGSGRAGSVGDTDIWVSHRKDVHDDLGPKGWEAPFNLPSSGLEPVNTKAFEAGASYFENEEGRGGPQLFFGRGVSGPTQNTTTDIWVADLLPDGTFGNAREVPELNDHQAGDQRPSIRFDGLEIFFYSYRKSDPSDPNADISIPNIWVATRRHVADDWDAPVKVVNRIDPTSAVDTRVNTEAADTHPHISPDGRALYFASSRPGGCGGLDLYMTQRTRLDGEEEDEDQDERSADN